MVSHGCQSPPHLNSPATLPLVAGTFLIPQEAAIHPFP